MRTYYVDINTSASSGNDGLTPISPWTYTEFKAQISAYSTADDYTFHLKGIRELSLGATESWRFSVASGCNIDVRGWPTETEPWKITRTRASGGTDRLYISVDNATKLTMQGGMIQNIGTAGYVENIIIIATSSVVNQTFSADNMHFQGGAQVDLLLNNWDAITVQNSNISCREFNCYTNSTTAYLVNSIFSVNDLKAGYVSYGTPTRYLIYDCVFGTKTVASYTGSPYMFLSDYQEQWTVPASLSATEVSALSASDLNYLNADYDSITMDGIKTTPYATGAWWSGRRDGVGALYFPEMSFVASASSTHVSAGEVVLVGTTTDMSAYNVSAFRVDWGDGSYTLSATDGGGDAATHIYTSAALFELTLSATSYNKWYDHTSDLEVGCYGDLAEASFVCSDYQTSATVTSSTEIEIPILFTPTVDSGTAWTYEWDFGDGNVSATYARATAFTTLPSVVHEFSAAGEYTVTLRVNCISAGDGRIDSYTSAYEVSAVTTSRVLYVNINEAYDTAPLTATSGTEAYPYTYSQFATRLGGTGRKYDVYKTVGGRTITTTLSADPTKFFTMDATHPAVTGPWMINVSATGPTDNARLELGSVALRNGIIAVLPFESDKQYGCEVAVTNMHDMFVVVQGEDSKLRLEFGGGDASSYSVLTSGGAVTLVDGSIIKGCTIYTTNGIFPVNLGDGSSDCQWHDSVFAGAFNVGSVDGSYDIKNCTFDVTAETVSATFVGVDAPSACQFEWTPPAAYPLTPTSDTYRTDIYGLLFDKTVLRVFDGITTPPQPGDGHPLYEWYETGLFGNSRANYHISPSTSGSIGAFFLGDYGQFVAVDALTTALSIVEPTVGQGTEVVVRPQSLQLVLLPADPAEYLGLDFNCSFTATPIAGTSPIVVDFTAQASQTAAHLALHGAITTYRWYFDLSGAPSTYVDTTEPTITHIFRGYAGQSFTVKLTVLAADASPISSVRTAYIVTCGVPSDMRYGDERLINLREWLPESLQSTEMVQFIGFFENYLNTMFEGTRGFSATSVDAVEMFTSAVGLSGDRRDIEDLTFTSASGMVDATKTISILEKIERITELHDPELIDMQFVNHFAELMGYSVTVSRGEIGLPADSGACSAVDTERYIRFVLQNLPHWYKMRVTEDCIKTALFSFGLVGSVINFYTDTYTPQVSGGSWRYGTLSWNGTRMHESLDDIPDSYYPTSHYAVFVDLLRSTTNFTYNTAQQNQILRAIESLRPVNAVFRGVVSYAAPEKRSIYVRPYTRNIRVIKVTSTVAADSWNV